jgi:predicted transcriptional regulator
MRIIKVGIMPKEKMRDYTLQLAKGKIRRGENDPKIFFPSLRSLAEALNDNSQALLSAINQHKPGSIKELAGLVSKDAGNVSRTLKRLEQYGFVQLISCKDSKDKRPVSLADAIEMEIHLTSAA